MAMHHARKSKAERIIGTQTDPAVITELLKAEEFTSEEIAELLNAPPANGSDLPKGPDVSKFDYKELTGDQFKEYEKLIASLVDNDKYFFEQYRVQPVITDLYPGLKDSPKEMTGLKITVDKPLHTTKVPVHVAKNLNAQVRNTNKYYFFKKEQ